MCLNPTTPQACRFPMEYVGLQWVSDQACRSPMGLRSDLSVSDGTPARHVGLRWVSGKTCQSLMGLRSDITISDGPPIMRDSCQRTLLETMAATGIKWNTLLILIFNCSAQNIYLILSNNIFVNSVKKCALIMTQEELG